MNSRTCTQYSYYGTSTHNSLLSLRCDTVQTRTVAFGFQVCASTRGRHFWAQTVIGATARALHCLRGGAALHATCCALRCTVGAPWRQRRDYACRDYATEPAAAKLAARRSA